MFKVQQSAGVVTDWY